MINFWECNLKPGKVEKALNIVLKKLPGPKAA